MKQVCKQYYKVNLRKNYNSRETIFIIVKKLKIFIEYAFTYKNVHTATEKKKSEKGRATPVDYSSSERRSGSGVRATFIQICVVFCTYTGQCIG